MNTTIIMIMENELRIKSEIEAEIDNCRHQMGECMKSGNIEGLTYLNGKVSALYWVLKQE